MKKEFYDCYSYNLMKFMESHSEYPVSTSKHSKSNATMWIYKRNPKFNDLLGLYTLEGKRKKEAN